MVGSGISAYQIEAYCGWYGPAIHKTCPLRLCMCAIIKAVDVLTKVHS